MTIGQRIREIRRRRDKTLKEVAEASGLSLTYLSDVERGRTQPSLKTLQRLAEGLEVTTTDLMSGVDDLGDATEDAVPEGLRELMADPAMEPLLTEEWIKTLQRIDYRGRRPQTKLDWQTLFLTMRNIMGEQNR